MPCQKASRRPSVPESGGAVEDLDPEDAKLITLARGARARVEATDGAALRDETGRTYASASVDLPSLRLSALQAAVAQASAAGARGVEAAVVVGEFDEVDAEGLAALHELGGEGVRVIIVGVDGTVGG
jgi:hypothetical protein